MKNQPDPLESYIQTERAIAIWCDEVIRSRHSSTLRKFAEGDHAWSRIYAYLFVKLNGYTTHRSRHQNMMGGNGFRKGKNPVYVTGVTCELKKWGSVVATKRFPLNIRIN